jgi:4-amino-4-deoxy-L-arabinose transferase-like glycosyltransferase
VSARRRRALLILLSALVLALRLPLLGGPGLWADESFSLAMATGHSLEHRAADADPAMGDFEEHQGAMPAGAWGRYLHHDTPPAGVRRITRAVFISDTSPPLYYVLLGGWIRGLGASDVALRLFSVLWAVLTVPLLWLLACRLGGTSAAIPAVLLYALAPTGLYYSGEGRMYSLLWCLALAFTWLTLRLHDRGTAPGRLASWSLCGAAGLLTHYFFAFVWLGCLLWLLRYPGRARRAWLGAAASTTLLLAAPWYVRVPESFGHWRVTGDWLAGHITGREALTNPPKLAWSLASGRGLWGGSRPANRLAQLLFVVVLLAPLFRHRRAFLRPRARLVWIWLAAVSLGPVVVDLLKGSSTSAITRYALAGLPAAMLLAGLALSRLRRGLSTLLVTLILVTWLPGVLAVLTHASQYRREYFDAARTAARWAGPADLVIIHSIPSGVLGVARYLPPAVPVAAWVGQLDQRRVPEDVSALVAGRRRVVFVRIHDVGAPAPEEDWLRAHARLIGEGTSEGPSVLAFEMNSVVSPLPASTSQERDSAAAPRPVADPPHRP